MVQAYLSLKNRAWRTPDNHHLPAQHHLRCVWLTTSVSGAQRHYQYCPMPLSIEAVPTAARGHVFQRQYTTNFAKWFDEAASGSPWIQWENKILDDLLNNPTPKSPVKPLWFQYGPVMQPPHGPYGRKSSSASLRKTYEDSGHPLNWERHHQVIETVTGHSITELYREFARDFWIQSFSPTPLIDLTALTRTEGLKIDLALDGNGDITFSDTRPPLSGMRFVFNRPCLSPSLRGSKRGDPNINQSRCRSGLCARLWG